MPTTQIGIQTTFNATGVAAADVALGKVAATANKADRELLAYANTVARAQRAQGDAAGAMRTYEAALAQVDRTSKQAISTAGQLASAIKTVERSTTGLQALPRTVESFGADALGQIKSGLLGIVGPAALVTAGFSAVRKAIDLTEESFKLKAALDTTNLSIQLQLRNFRDVNQALAEGSAFADRYNITQQENAESIQASIPLLRQSKASLTDVEGVLARMAVLKPEQGIRGAAFALGELEGNQSRSLATRFNIPLAKANELRDAIRNGGDAIQVMSAYLDSVGLGMDTLDVRTTGATGKMNALKVETENFMLALGGQAGGPGLVLLEARIAATANATRLLSGDTKTIVSDFGGLAVALNPVAQVLAAVGVADDALISKFNTLAGTSIPSLFAPINASIDAWKHYISVVLGIPEGVPGSDKVKDDLVSIVRDANLAADAVAAALGNKPLPHLTDKGPSVGGTNKGVLEGLFGGGAATIEQFKRDSAEAQALADVLFDNKLKRAKDNAAKIALLRQKQNATTDPVERARIEGQIIDLQSQKVGGLQKEANLQESIYDSIAKQKAALLDIEELTIKDRQTDRDAAKANRIAQRIIDSPNASADMKARAADVIALNSVQDRQRAADIAQKQATAGGTISASGKLLQSVPGGTPAAAPVGAAALAAVPTQAPQPATAPAAAGGALMVNVIIDGKTAWSGMAPYAWTDIVRAAQGVA